MIDEVSDTLGWDRKHTIKALNGQVAHGSKAGRRGSKPTSGAQELAIIVAIWKHSEQPCGVRLKQTLPLWIESYQARHGAINKTTRGKILGYSPRTLERITAPHRGATGGRIGRKTGWASNRLKKFVPIRCSPQVFDEPGWLEADTVSHGGSSSSGFFLWRLTLTDFHSGWTELAALWGNSGGEVRCGLERIEKRLPFPMLGFDCDNGSEFFNEIVEAYLLRRNRSIEWTRSRAYKKNDQAHVEQKNFTHVRQLLGYGRFADLELRGQVNDLYEKAWLPLRNHFTPVMKLIEKQRTGSKVLKKYDNPATPCDRLLACAKVSEETKNRLRATRATLDPMDLAADIEARLGRIFTIVERIEEDRQDEIARAGKANEGCTVVADCIPATHRPLVPDLDLIARQTRLIIRDSRKFSAAGFLQSLLSSVVTGLASLNQIAGDLKDRNHPGMARQSLHERFDSRSTAFLMAVLCDLMQQRYRAAARRAERHKKARDCG